MRSRLQREHGLVVAQPPAGWHFVLDDLRHTWRSRPRSPKPVARYVGARAAVAWYVRHGIQVQRTAGRRRLVRPRGSVQKARLRDAAKSRNSCRESINLRQRGETRRSDPEPLDGRGHVLGVMRVSLGLLGQCHHDCQSDERMERYPDFCREVLRLFLGRLRYPNERLGSDGGNTGFEQSQARPSRQTVGLAP